MIIAVSTTLNVNTLDEQVAPARREPGKLSLAPMPGTIGITFDQPRWQQLRPKRRARIFQL